MNRQGPCSAVAHGLGKERRHAHGPLHCSVVSVVPWAGSYFWGNGGCLLNSKKGISKWEDQRSLLSWGWRD